MSEEYEHFEGPFRGRAARNVVDSEARPKPKLRLSKREFSGLVKQDAWLGEATVDYKTRIIDWTDTKVKREIKSARAPIFA